MLINVITDGLEQIEDGLRQLLGFFPVPRSKLKKRVTCASSERLSILTIHCSITRDPTPAIPFKGLTLEASPTWYSIFKTIDA